MGAIQLMQEVFLNIDVIAETARSIFPSADQVDEDGFLASGGDISLEMLIMAYCIGVFPWYSENNPILWWSPDPRMVFPSCRMKTTTSLRKNIDSGKYTVTFDTAFNQVIFNCAGVKRKDQGGTWITKEMLEAYSLLHEEGYAHSVESWFEGKLAGGLYGLSIGGIFFGESMFHLMTDASKVAFFHLSEKLKKWDFDLIDGQVPNPHLVSLGGKEIPRSEFLLILDKSIRKKTRLGSWSC